MICGRTDLRTGVSKAKFDPGVEFDVRLDVAPRKRHEKMIFRSENCVEKNFRRQIFFRLGIVRNAFWQSFAGPKIAKNCEKTVEKI